MKIKEIKIKIKNLYKGGFFHIFGGNILTKMILFLSSIVVVRLITKSEYAYLSYADNLYLYINLLSGLGISTAVLIYCSNAKSVGEDKAYLFFALKWGSIFQFFFSLTIVVYSYFADIPFPNARNLILTLILYPFLTYVLTVIQNYIRAHMENRLFAKMSVIQAILVLSASILFVRLIGLLGIAIARYISIIVVVFIGGKYVLSNVKGVSKIELSNLQIKLFMNMSISLMIANLFSMIMPLNEMFLINELIRDETITANYKIANLIPSQLGFITSSIVIYYFPIIAKMTDLKDVWKESKKVGIFTGSIILIITVTGIIFSPIIIRFTYGTRYLDSNNMSIIFWIVYALNSGFRMIPMNILPAIGKSKFNAVVSMVSCLIHVVMDYFFIKVFGIVGAAIAIGIVYLISGIVYWIYLYKVCKNEDREVIL